MTRSAARASAAADALLDWLRTQKPDAMPDIPTTAIPAGHWDVAGTSAPQRAPAPGQHESKSGAPLCLPHTDWLYHRLTISGPAQDVAAFHAAAAGAGSIPWQFDLDRMEEDFFHLLVSPPPPQQRSLSLSGARIVAAQLREAVARRHALAVARVGSSQAGAASQACPFDLHALVPVPDAVLRLGPDDPAALSWLWENWGTTQALRHVVADTAAGLGGRRQPSPADAVARMTFWSADWTPWRALAHLAVRWSTLRFEIRPSYDPP